MHESIDYLDQLRIHQESWDRKGCLREEYGRFFQLILKHLAPEELGDVLEIGSGIGALKSTIQSCQLSDLISTPWVARREDVYALSCDRSTLSNVILFDVFHHLKYPGTALSEIYRCLAQGGRVHIFEPYISFLGYLVYGLIHEEPMGLNIPIELFRTGKCKPGDEMGFYAAQGNATRLFYRDDTVLSCEPWKIVTRSRLSAIAYLGTGGFSKPAFCPGFLFPLLRSLEPILDCFPDVFATRCYVVLEKTGE